MPRVTVALPGFKCLNCGHEWVPRYQHPPKVCPVCKRTDWDGDIKHEGLIKKGDMDESK